MQLKICHKFKFNWARNRIFTISKYFPNKIPIPHRLEEPHKGKMGHLQRVA